jgi:hypothetical protein
MKVRREYGEIRKQQVDYRKSSVTTVCVLIIQTRNWLWYSKRLESQRDRVVENLLTTNK